MIKIFKYFFRKKASFNFKNIRDNVLLISVLCILDFIFFKSPLLLKFGIFAAFLTNFISLSFLLKNSLGVPKILLLMSVFILSSSVWLIQDDNFFPLFLGVFFYSILSFEFFPRLRFRFFLGLILFLCVILIPEFFSENLKNKLTESLSALILFGSHARGDFTKNSDYDFLIILKEKNYEHEFLSKCCILIFHFSVIESG